MGNVLSMMMNGVISKKEDIDLSEKWFDAGEKKAWG